MERNSIFETKMNNVLDWSKHLLNTIPINGEIKDLSSKRNLKQIFNNHPLKSKCINPQRFIVTRHPVYKNKCFAAVGENMELFPFSMKNAMQSRINFRSTLHQLCRMIVKDQVFYKKENIIKKIGLVCQKTGNVYPKKNLQLHHEPPYEFNIICDSFLKSNGVQLNESLFKYDNLGELSFNDTKLKYEFLKYHARFLNDGHVSLVSSKINQKLGTSYKFKNTVLDKSDKMQIIFKVAHSVQLNLFSELEA